MDWPAEIRNREAEAELLREPGQLLIVDLWGIPEDAIRESRKSDDQKKREAMEYALDLERQAAKAESLADMLANKGEWDAADKQRARAAELRREAQENRNV